MSDMRFLFDKEFDSFVGALHGALVKKHALDALLEKAANYAHSPEDQALTEMAKRRSRELASQIPKPSTGKCRSGWKGFSNLGQSPNHASVWPRA